MQLNHTKLLYKELSYELQGSIFEIRKEYGSGHKEKVYQNLLADYLNDKGLKVEKEKSINVYSNKTGKVVGRYQPDIIVEDKIVVEIKAARFTTQQAEKQLYHYLKNSEYELGYLINFGSQKLFTKRMIFTNDRKFISK